MSLLEKETLANVLEVPMEVNTFVPGLEMQSRRKEIG